MNQFLDDVFELMFQRRLITAIISILAAFGILAGLFLAIGFLSGHLRFV